MKAKFEANSMNKELMEVRSKVQLLMIIIIIIFCFSCLLVMLVVFLPFALIFVQTCK